MGGALPLAPTQQKADADPFAILTANSPHASLAAKPQSPLKSGALRNNKSAADIDPFTFSASPMNTGNSSAGDLTCHCLSCLPPVLRSKVVKTMTDLTNARLRPRKYPRSIVCTSRAFPSPQKYVCKYMTSLLILLIARVGLYRSAINHAAVAYVRYCT